MLIARGEDEASFVYVEPSAGAGVFLGVLPVGRTTAMDVEPRHPDVVRQDYLDWRPVEKKGQRVVVFGNPPFGLRGQLALRFINHSAFFAEYVCFILPPLFESDGKGARAEPHLLGFGSGRHVYGSGGEAGARPVRFSGLVETPYEPGLRRACCADGRRPGIFLVGRGHAVEHEEQGHAAGV